jgi:hypothetical protein
MRPYKRHTETTALKLALNPSRARNDSESDFNPDKVR